MKSIFRIITLFSMIRVGVSFMNNYKTTIINRQYNNENIDIYSNTKCEESETPAVLFFTGLNSIVPKNVYDDFLKELTRENITCYIGVNNMETNDELIDDILESHTNLTVMGHSSGCLTACKSINKKKDVVTAVLLDPVDNSFIFDQKSKPNLNHIENILIINAKLSYEWNWDNTLPEMPFIPAFRMTSDSLKLKSPEIMVLEADDYGHTDILNKPWTDIMHNSLSRGTSDRSKKNLQKYRTWIVSSIYNFIHKNNTYTSLTDTSLQRKKLW